VSDRCTGFYDAETTRPSSSVDEPRHKAVSMTVTKPCQRDRHPSWEPCGPAEVGSTSVGGAVR
jgi:hypothetical protein